MTPQIARPDGMAGCARCLHIYDEHTAGRMERRGNCQPTIPGGSECDCRAFIPKHATAERHRQSDLLRLRAAELVDQADRLDEFVR